MKTTIKKAAFSAQSELGTLPFVHQKSMSSRFPKSQAVCPHGQLLRQKAQRFKFVVEAVELPAENFFVVLFLLLQRGNFVDPPLHDAGAAAAALDSHELHGLPGFYTKDGTWTLAGANGFLIPVRNKDGLIQGMKIRLDDDAARKYRWLSSRPNRMENGARSYSWIHVTGDTTQKRAYLTEGPLKGDIASYFANDALFVCLGGVNAHKGLRETLLSLGVTEVMEAMDMDQFTNPQVRQAIGTLRREVQSIQGIRYYQCTWNPRFKGVDDYLLDWTKRRTA